MNKKEIFTAGIFFIGFLSLLLVAFNALLTPIRGDIVQIETRLNGRMDRLEEKIETIRTELNTKIDQLIFALVKDKVAETKPLKKPSAKTPVAKAPVAKVPVRKPVAKKPFAKAPVKKPLQAVPRDKQAKN